MPPTLLTRLSDVAQWLRARTARGGVGRARGRRVPPGELDRLVLAAHGIEERVACLEVNASVLLGETPKVPIAKPVSRFPSSDFDLAFAAPTRVTAGALQRALRQAAGALGE